MDIQFENGITLLSALCMLLLFDPSRLIKNFGKESSIFSLVCSEASLLLLLIRGYTYLISALECIVKSTILAALNSMQHM